MNKDQSKGRIQAANGRAREIVGKVKGNEALQQKGRRQKDLGTASDSFTTEIHGRAQAAYGDLQERIKNAPPAP